MGHRRLSIVDLSSNADQPIKNADESVVVVFNGEIYNYKEIRNDLMVCGIKFETDSDSEVLLNSYLMWGIKCVERFIGMFAFAVYDARQNKDAPKVYLVRDRVGEKPLYFCKTTSGLEFGSELKALSSKSRIDATALNHYLFLGYVPGSKCIVEGVEKLEPGCIASYDTADKAFKVERYWSLPLSKGSTLGRDELAESAWSILSGAVRRQLSADVPVGVFLSGGLDSSLVTAAAAEISNGKIKTFTVGVSGTKFDESEHARRIAEHFDTEHHLLEFPSNPLREISSLFSLIDEPLADSSLVPSFLISKLTASSVKVALGGDGGDEVFGGYNHYSRYLKYENSYGYLDSKFARLIARTAGKLPAGAAGRNGIYSLRKGLINAWALSTTFFDDALRSQLLSDDCRSALGLKFTEPELSILSHLCSENGDLVEQLMRLDFKTLLVDDYLVKIDRASMANGLEIRSPFLDHQLVEYAYKYIPTSEKVAMSERRIIQNVMAKKHLPPTFELGRKQGFSIPIDLILNENETRERLMALPTEYFNRSYIGSLYKGYQKGRSNGARLFSLLMFSFAYENLKIA